MERDVSILVALIRTLILVPVLVWRVQPHAVLQRVAQLAVVRQIQPLIPLIVLVLLNQVFEFGLDPGAFWIQQFD